MSDYFYSLGYILETFHVWDHDDVASGLAEAILGNLPLENNQ